MQYRLPAEWEPVQSVMLTWPHREGDWKPIFDSIHECYLGLARAIQPYANLIISANNEEVAEQIRRDISVLDNVSIFTVPSNDTWVRDHGPVTVYEDNTAVLLDFVFNGWGGKYPAAEDNLLTQSLYNAGAFPGFDYQQVDFILEGGSIDTDGQGTLLTTKSCLLSKSRNSTMSQHDIEALLARLLGAKHILWLENSELAGDDTDGHIDMLARFIDHETIAYTASKNRRDPNYASLLALKAELELLIDSNGNPYNLLPLYMPEPVYAQDGQQLPASYANFLIVNNAVLVPTYNCEADLVAISALEEVFNNHNVIGVPCRALVEQFGSLHCATMQLPRTHLE